jgi:hypothetical protein
MDWPGEPETKTPLGTSCANVIHSSDAVDMDIYGAFQLCAIGILAVPVSAKLSNTYSNLPGRNTIFIWFALVLSGEP